MPCTYKRTYFENQRCFSRFNNHDSGAACRIVGLFSNLESSQSSNIVQHSFRENWLVFFYIFLFLSVFFEWGVNKLDTQKNECTCLPTFPTEQIALCVSTSDGIKILPQLLPTVRILNSCENQSLEVKFPRVCTVH